MRNLTRYILFSILLLVGNCIWAATYPDVEFETTDANTTNWYKAYYLDGGDSIVVSTTYSISSNSGDYYVQLGSTSSNAATNYVAIDASEPIDKVEFLVSSNASVPLTKTLTPALLGWSVDTVFSQASATVGIFTDTINVTGGYANARWLSYDLSSLPYSLNKLRLFRGIRYVNITYPSVVSSSTVLGSTMSVRIYGYRVFLRKAEKPVLTSLKIKNYAPNSIKDTMTISTYSGYATGTAMTLSDVSYTTDSADCTVSFLKNGSAIKSFSIGDTITMTITKNLRTSTYVIITSGEAPAPTIALDGNSGSVSQRVRQNSAIEPIIFDVENDVSSYCENLPEGLTYNAKTHTISGAPTGVIGSYTYKIVIEGNTSANPSSVSYTGTIKVMDSNAKSILYLTANSTSEDLFYNSLIDNYIVTVTTPGDVAKDSSAYSAYDLIVLQESVSSTNVEILGLKNINKPLLNMKAYIYGTASDATARWGWGNPDNGLGDGTSTGSGAVSITFNYASHPIFADFDVSDGSIQILNSIFSTDVNKTIQVIKTSSISGYSVALSGGYAAIQEILPSVRVNSSSTSKYLLIAIYNKLMNALNSDGITLLNNAVTYLLGSDIFDYSSQTPLHTSVINTSKGVRAKVVVENNNIRIEGGDGADVNIFSVAGNKILSKNNISSDELFSVTQPGVYVVKVDNNAVKVVVR